MTVHLCLEVMGTNYMCMCVYIDWYRMKLLVVCAVLYQIGGLH